MSPVIPQQSLRVQTLRFIACQQLLRSLGLALGAVMIAMVFYTDHAGPAEWTLLILYCLCWPHLARALAQRHAKPMHVERRSTLIDSAGGGLWLVMMHFNLLPSALLIALLAMDCVGVGGGRLLLRGILVQAATCGAAIAIFGFHPIPDTSRPELLASLPLAMLYPLAVAGMAHRLNRRVHQQNRLLAHIGRMDGLSELLNRAHWEEAVEGTLENLRTSGCSASLLMMDIDHFKQINDYYGHTIGDEVIGRVGAIIRRSMREGDIAGRYGGDEFGVVLNGVNAATAAQIAERIRASVHAATFEQAEDLRCTLSIGIAEAAADMRNAREWIRQADAALYDAKTRGRNRLALINANWQLKATAA